MAIFFVVLTVGFSLTVRTRYRMLLRLSKSFWTFFNFFQGKEEGFWLDWDPQPGKLLVYTTTYSMEGLPRPVSFLTLPCTLITPSFNHSVTALRIYTVLIPV